VTIHHSGENAISGHSGLAAAGWDWQLASWIKQIGSPPVTALTGVILVGALLSTVAAWLWVLWYGLLAVVVPSLYVLVLYQRGVVSDIHLRIRSERIRPTLVTLATAVTTWLLLFSGNGPTLLIALATVNVIQTTLFFAITLYWKISAHTGSAATLAVLAAWGLTGIAAVPIVLSVPLIAWSRVRLEDHTPAQTVMGAVLGSLIISVVLLLYSG
jgi:membrane-associated phospholipid phosphatase